MEDMHKVTYTITVTVDGNPKEPEVFLEVDGKNTNIATVASMSIVAASNSLANAYRLTLVDSEDKDSEDRRKAFVLRMLPAIMDIYQDAVGRLLSNVHNIELVEK